MADKRTTPEAPEGAPQAAPEGPRRKKRAAPTIDLTATEVPPSASPQQPDPPAATAEPPQPADTASAKPAMRTGPSFGAAAIAGGAAGVAATLLVMLGLWIAGLLPLQEATSATVPTQVTGDGKTLAALAQRIGKIEQEIGKIPPGDENLSERIAALRVAINSLSTDLVAFYRRSDEIAASAAYARTHAEAAQKAVTELSTSVQGLTKTAAAGISSAELDALQNRIAALEQSAKIARDDIVKASSADMAARLALSAASLREAVASGAPFAGELAAVKSLGGDDEGLPALAPLAPFATSGVPTAQALADELHALLPAMVKNSSAPAPQGGFLERLEAGAGTLMRFRPLNAPAGDDASSVLARLEIDASKADVAAALDDFGKLDSATRAPAQRWIAKARARQAALAAAKQYASGTARALGSKAGAR